MLKSKRFVTILLAFMLIITLVPAISASAAPDDLDRLAVYNAASGNIARSATVTADYSNGTSVATNANNGSLSTGTSSTAWNTWGTSLGTRTTPVNIWYTWSEPKAIDTMRVMWWIFTDSGVNWPYSCNVQYLDGNGEWITIGAVGVSGNSGGGSDRPSIPISTWASNTAWNVVRFDEPVVTTSLRLQCYGSKTSGTSPGLGISEWEVFEADGDPELLSVSVAGSNQPTITEVNTYTANVIYPTLEGVTYEWSVDDDDIIKIVGDNTGKTVNVEAADIGAAKLTVTAKHDSGVLETTGSMDITVNNISVDVTGDAIVPVGGQNVFTSTAKIGTLTDVEYEWSLDNTNATIAGSATGSTVTVGGVTGGDAKLTVKVSSASAGLEATGSIDLTVKEFKAETYETNTAAGRAPILPNRVVVDGLRFDVPTESATGNNNFNFAETFEESLVAVEWDMDSFTAADYAADKVGTTFEVTGVTTGDRAPGYPAKAIITVNEPQAALDYNHSVTSENVIFDDDFWKPKQLVNATTTFDHAVSMLESTGSSYYAVQNFKNSVTRLTSIWEGDLSPSNPTYNGYVFQDTDVYKTLEGFSYNLAAVWNDASVTDARKAELLAKAKEWISLIEQVQYADGYIDTAFSSRYQGSSGGSGTGNWRWRYFARHEMYNIGHFLEAAVAYTRFSVGIGEDDYTLYEVGKRAADHIVNLFGPDGTRTEVPGHEEIELAMMKFAVLAEEYEGVGAGQKYRDTVETLVDRRGRRTGAYVRESGYSGGTYSQDATPLVSETAAVGHAVRAMYYYTGATDVAISMPVSNPNKTAFLTGITNIYNSVSEKNTYITGGLGSGESSEGFGSDYSLRCSSAYTETCAAIAGANWYQRLNLYYEDAKYADSYERALYNGVLVGVNLSGNLFYYGCGLDGSSAARSSWFGCACCPPNVIRTIANISGYMYTVNKDAIFVNLYGGSTGNINVQGENVEIIQETNYPWEGAVGFTVTPETDKDFTLNLRIPGWVKAQKYQQVTIKVDGVEIDATPSAKGYVAITRTWSAEGTIIEMDIPMEIRLTEADDNVGTATYTGTSAVDNRQNNKVVVERGPIVYNLETPGVPSGDPETATTGRDARYVYLSRDTELTATYNPDLLRGVVEITGYAKWNAPTGSYNTYNPPSGEATQYIQLTPYYSRNNRGNNPQNTGSTGSTNSTSSFRVWLYATEKTVQIQGAKNEISVDDTVDLTATPHVNYNVKDEAISYEWSVDGKVEIVSTAAGLTDDSGANKVGGVGFQRPTGIASIKATREGTATVTVTMKDGDGAVLSTDTYVITVARDADYYGNSLLDLIYKCNALNEDYYTEASWTALNTAIDDALAVLDSFDNGEATQSQVNQAYNNLAKAYAGLVSSIDPGAVDKFELAMYIGIAKDILTEEGTALRPSSKKALEDALVLANYVNSSKYATQEMVNDVAFDLLSAIINRKDIVDRSDLEELIAIVEGMDSSRYVEDGWAPLMAALENAKLIGDESSAAEIRNAYSDLQLAVNGLELLPVTNKEALASAMKNTKAILDDIDSFIPSTVEGLAALYAEAKIVYDDILASQDDVNAMTAKLMAANVKARVKEDKTALIKAIGAGTSLKASDYTSASYATLSKALTAAAAVRDDELATRDEITTAATAVNNAIAALKTNATTISVSGVKMNKTSASLVVGKTLTLSATVSPANAADKTVTWKSSDTKIATVKNGVVTGVKGGKVTITATTRDGAKIAKSTVTVNAYVSMQIGKRTAVNNGNKTTIDSNNAYPFKISGRTMLPIRFVSEKMGGTVKYTSDSAPIVITYGTTKVEIKLGSKTMKVIEGTKSRSVKLDVAAQKRDGRTYLPIRAVSEALGFQVYYEANGQYIVVNNPTMTTAVRNERLAEAKKIIK